ncbi:MAG: recombinase RecT [Sphaerochaeta sp.]|jgi:hypothetical protein|nr:recombinase RecT [Sphaerochaeta sp.]
MSEKEIIRTQDRFPTTSSWEAVMSISKHLSESKALPACIQNASQLTMVLLAGKECGMGAMESLNAFYIVNGKITVYGSAVLSQLKRAGYKVKWGKCDAKEVSVKIISPDGDEHDEAFTMEQAVKTGQTGKEPWQKYPVNMLRWKCLGNAVRFFCPEVIYGHYMKEDIEATTQEAEAIDVTVTETKQEETANQPF